VSSAGQVGAPDSGAGGAAAADPPGWGVVTSRR
jgi:hypothetical protein